MEFGGTVRGLCPSPSPCGTRQSPSPPMGEGPGEEKTHQLAAGTTPSHPLLSFPPARESRCRAGRERRNPPTLPPYSISTPYGIHSGSQQEVSRTSFKTLSHNLQAEDQLSVPIVQRKVMETRVAHRNKGMMSMSVSLRQPIGHLRTGYQRRSIKQISSSAQAPTVARLECSPFDEEFGFGI